MPINEEMRRLSKLRTQNQKKNRNAKAMAETEANLRSDVETFLARGGVIETVESGETHDPLLARIMKNA